MSAETPTPPNERWWRRLPTLAAHGVEPVMEIVMLMIVVAATRRLTADIALGSAALAAAVALELAVCCWLLSARLERRARIQEYALVELLLGIGGEFAAAFPRCLRRARERVEAQMKLSQLTVQDMLEMTRETPCAPTRAVTAWVALALVLAAVEQWAWGAILHRETVNLVAGAAIAWGDLRHGRTRDPRSPRRARRWGEGYRPESPSTILPSADSHLGGDSNRCTRCRGGESRDAPQASGTWPVAISRPYALA